MNKYHNGKIYKITDVGYHKCYIGSTCERLSQRLTRHRSSYKQHLKGTYNRCKCFDLFDEFGTKNVKIELIEYYICNDKNELLQREGHYIRNSDCMNKYIPNRSKQEYEEEFKDYLSDKKKEYYHKHKDNFYTMFKDKMKNDNDFKEAHLDKLRKYYHNNKEKFQHRRSQIIECCCGSAITRHHQNRHEQSKKHQYFILNQQEATHAGSSV